MQARGRRHVLRVQPCTQHGDTAALRCCAVSLCDEGHTQHRLAVPMCSVSAALSGATNRKDHTMSSKAKGTKSTKATTKRATVADAMERIDGMESALSAIANAVGATGEGSTEPAKASEATESKPQPTRTVVLPELQLFREEKRAIGQDATYPSNIALFKLNADGAPMTKKDGALRKPNRMRVEDARFILAHAKEVAALCDQIEAGQQPAS